MIDFAIRQTVVSGDEIMFCWTVSAKRIELMMAHSYTSFATARSNFESISLHEWTGCAPLPETS